MAQRHLAYAVRAGLHGEGSSKVIIEDGREAGLQVAPDDFVIDDPQLVEGRLDELAPHLGIGVLVARRTDPAQQERLIEGFLNGGVVGLVLLDDRPSRGQLALYPILLALEHVDRQRVSQVGLGELVALAFQLLDAGPLRGDALAAAALPFEHPVHDDAADGGALLLIELDPPLPVHDGCGFHGRYGHEGLLAVGALLLTPDAVEVRVDGAVVAA